MKIALTIAGSDSGGGAGIQADLRTFQRFGVFGTSAITAVTAQNTQGIRAVHTLPAELVVAQIAALAEDLPPAAVKSGMLGSLEVARATAGALSEYAFANYVLDPVVVASSGERLLDPGAESELLARLVPLAALVTPNLAEAALLTGLGVRTPDDMERAGQALLAAGAAAVLVTGGHLPGDDLVDLLVTPTLTRRFEHRRIATRSTHGTGCTLSAAITAGLALGRTLEDAVDEAISYVQRALVNAPGLGKGSGPLV
jgi:hydroxymethylpyrimidine/phosphomethylpyrimidine kinase